jgi:hypothetical protein
MMSKASKIALFVALSLVAGGKAADQTSYHVVSVSNSGMITGTVKWSGPLPRALALPINKDVEVCDPESHKTRNLERLVVGPQGGVANTVVFLKNVYSGKPFNFPESRRFLDQKNCRYEPHVMLVAQDAALRMNSSDPVLHTIHMDGAATYNLPFPFTNQAVSRTMRSPGLVNVKCNGGHVWMNAEIMVAPHPYYAVTDESGKFELTDVPPGEYEIVAWHEGWSLLRQQAAIDVLTQRTIQRPVFSEPRTWQTKVTVGENETAVVKFVLSDK